MPYLFLINFLFCFSSPVISQAHQIYSHCSVWKDAQMDEKHWKKYLDKNLEPDSLATDTIPRGTYKIIAQFIIDKEGCITNVKIVSDPGYGLAARVIRAISSYDGICIPSEQNGRKVKACRKQEITLVFGESKCEKIPAIDFML